MKKNSEILNLQIQASGTWELENSAKITFTCNGNFHKLQNLEKNKSHRQGWDLDISVDIEAVILGGKDDGPVLH